MNDLHPAQELAKGTPAAGYLAAYFAGFSIPDYINVCMAVYATYLAVSSIYKFCRWCSRRFSGSA